MKTVLERAEEVTSLLVKLKITNPKLLSFKVADSDPSSGSFRIRGFLDQSTFIQIFEYLFNGMILKYSYSLITNKGSILRYDNAPHHDEIDTKPHHKHSHDRIESLEDSTLDGFILEVKKLLKNIIS